MREEHEDFTNHKTWSIVKLPKGKKILDSKWIYKFKFHFDGSIERHKARLVAQEFTQTYAVDYKETFASIAQNEYSEGAIVCGCQQRMVHVSNGYENAFLHGDLVEDVYMKLPP